MIANDRPRTRLYRSRTDKKLAGVAGGVAEHLRIDPTLVRIGFVVLALVPQLGGFAILTYIVLAIICPERPIGEQEVSATSEVDASRLREIAGLLLVGFGLILLAGTFGVFQIFDWNRFWPIALIIVGALLIVKRTRIQ